MFRRFMIVCWIAFGAAAATAATGSYIAFQNRENAEALVKDWGIVPSDDLDEISQDLTANKNEWATYVEKLQAYEHELSNAESTPENNAKADEIRAELADATEQLEFISVDLKRYREIERRTYVGVSVFGLGLAAAGGLLAWNMLCHLAHWIWMGRKAGQ